MLIMWCFLFSGIFPLHHKAQTLNFTAVLHTRGHDVDTSVLNTAVAQDIRQFCDILFNAVKGSGKELSQVVWKYFGWIDACFFTELFHLRPYIAAIQRVAVFGYEDAACLDAVLFCKIQ